MACALALPSIAAADQKSTQTMPLLAKTVGDNQTVSEGYVNPAQLRNEQLTGRSTEKTSRHH